MVGFSKKTLVELLAVGSMVTAISCAPFLDQRFKPEDLSSISLKTSDSSFVDPGNMYSFDVSPVYVGLQPYTQKECVGFGPGEESRMARFWEWPPPERVSNKPDYEEIRTGRSVTFVDTASLDKVYFDVEIYYGKIDTPPAKQAQELFSKLMRTTYDFDEPMFYERANVFDDALRPASIAQLIAAADMQTHDGVVSVTNQFVVAYSDDAGNSRLRKYRLAVIAGEHFNYALQNAEDIMYHDSETNPVLIHLSNFSHTPEEIQRRDVLFQALLSGFNPR